MNKERPTSQFLESASERCIDSVWDFIDWVRDNKAATFGIAFASGLVSAGVGKCLADKTTRLRIGDTFETALDESGEVFASDLYGIHQPVGESDFGEPPYDEELLGEVDRLYPGSRWCNRLTNDAPERLPMTRGPRLQRQLCEAKGYIEDLTRMIKESRSRIAADKQALNDLDKARQEALLEKLRKERMELEGSLSTLLSMRQEAKGNIGQLEDLAASLEQSLKRRAKAEAMQKAAMLRMNVLWISMVDQEDAKRFEEEMTKELAEWTKGELARLKKDDHLILILGQIRAESERISDIDALIAELECEAKRIDWRANPGAQWLQ